MGEMFLRRNFRIFAYQKDFVRFIFEKTGKNIIFASIKKINKFAKNSLRANFYPKYNEVYYAVLPPDRPSVNHENVS